MQRCFTNIYLLQEAGSRVDAKRGSTGILAVLRDPWEFQAKWNADKQLAAVVVSYLDDARWRTYKWSELLGVDMNLLGEEVDVLLIQDLILLVRGGGWRFSAGPKINPKSECHKMKPCSQVEDAEKDKNGMNNSSHGSAFHDHYSFHYAFTCLSSKPCIRHADGPTAHDEKLNR